MREHFSIGIDFGTLSARAILIDVDTGREVVTSIYGYQDSVIDKYLPDSNVKLPPEFALQNPLDYKDALEALLKDIWKKADIPPEDIISIGVDFTSCTVIPVDKNMQPLCCNEKYRNNPHSWAKLWKHHGAQAEADLINQTARSRGEEFMRHYGNTSSSEWYFAKLIETFNKAPEVYRATYKFVEAGDWVVWLMTGKLTTSTCMAGYKAFWNEKNGYPSEEFFASINPALRGITQKTVSDVYTVGSRAGGLCPSMAKLTGLAEGTAVAVSVIDAHAAMPVVGVTQGSSLMMTAGTSLCHILVSEEEVFTDGICGVVKDGVLPGYYGYEAGQPAVGDIYEWFINNFVSSECIEEANEKDVSVFSVMDKKAEKLRPGESGLLALDWWNGNRSMLNNSNLSGVILGLTLSTTPESVYRALIESTAFGTRNIIESMEKHGVKIEHIYACGGLSRKSSFVMQTFCDVLGREIAVTGITQTTAYGAAIYGMVAAGKDRGGFDTFSEATQKLCGNPSKIFIPDMENHRVYEMLFEKYMFLNDLFGIEHKEIMTSLKELREAQRKDAH